MTIHSAPFIQFSWYLLSAKDTADAVPGTEDIAVSRTTQEFLNSGCLFSIVGDREEQGSKVS